MNAFHQLNGWTGEFRPFHELGQGGAMNTQQNSVARFFFPGNMP